MLECSAYEDLAPHEVVHHYPEIAVMKPLIIDFETRSRINLPRQGTTVYVRDTSTRVLCIGYQWEGKTVVIPWHQPHKNDPHRKVRPGIAIRTIPKAILVAVADPNTVIVAHNALFERAIWSHVLGWTEIDPSRWRCTANLAGLYNLPQALGNLAAYMFPKREEAQKDKRGQQLINLLSKPKSDGTFRTDINLLHEMYGYCAQDVKVTAKIFSLLPEPTPGEMRIQRADILANEIGYAVDRPFCQKAMILDNRLQDKVIRDHQELTGLRPTQTVKLQIWLKDRGCDLPDMTRQTVERVLSTTESLPPLIRSVLELRVAGARGSTQKFESLLRQSSPEFPRITHHTRYAAGNTCRWIARGAQIHNFRSRNLISYDLPGIKKEVMTDTLPRDVDVRNYIGGAVRAAIISEFPTSLALGDYSGMENRMLMFLSGEERQLDLIRSGLDVYRDLATRVFGISDPARIDPWQRQICKHMVLGLGFGMGYVVFFVNLKYKFQVDLTWEICSAIVDEDELNRQTTDLINRVKTETDYRVYLMKEVALDHQPLNRKTMYGLATTRYLVDLFRNDFDSMTGWWSDMDAGFKELMDSSPGSSIRFDPAGAMYRTKKAIVFVLPSGRPMYYWHPRMAKSRDPITRAPTRELVYDQATGGDMKTLKGYGARFGANFVQAISRDIMAYAFADLSDSSDYTPIVTVHDEIISETLNQDPSIYESLILESAQARSWSRDIPLKVDVDLSPCWLSKG